MIAVNCLGRSLENHYNKVAWGRWVDGGGGVRLGGGGGEEREGHIMKRRNTWIVTERYTHTHTEYTHTYNTHT